MSTWKDRVNKYLVLISPNNITFNAFWAGNSVAGKKNNGIFEFPEVEGAVIQPLKMGPFSYPLSFFFAGDDNDKQAIQFINALSEDGSWSIVHPVLGELELFLLTFKVTVDPVKSGNVTHFETEWIWAQLFDLVANNTLRPEAIARAANEKILDKFVEDIKQDAPGTVAKIAQQFQALSNTISENLKTLYTPVADLNKDIQSVRRAITSTLNQAVIDIAALGGEAQTLIQLPAQLDIDYHQRLDAYKDVLTSAYDFLPGVKDEDSKNTAAQGEGVIGAVIVATAQTADTAEPTTRAESVALINELTEIFDGAINELDTVQELFEDDSIDNQFYSQVDSFADLRRLIATVNNQVLASSFNLAIEKRIVLTKPRAPIEIVITEYGTLGEEDVNLDNFILANNLTGNEILILPPGKEVVVYV